jgi:ribosome biogenesis protein NSA1
LPQGALKGAAGSVRALALHPSEPLLASVGLDRFLRVHHTETRARLCSVYVKQQLTGVAWAPPPLPPPAAAGERAAAEGDAGQPAQAAAAKPGKRQGGKDRAGAGKQQKKRRRGEED